MKNNISTAFFLITSLIALIGFRTQRLIWLATFVDVVLYTGLVVWKIGKRMNKDIVVLKYGKLSKAHIIKIRTYHPEKHNTQKPVTSIDFMIPIEKRRSSAISIRVNDETTVTRLKEKEHMMVLCLPHAPGTCYIFDPILSESLLRSK